MYIVQSQVKAAVRRFSPLSPSLFEICNCSRSRNYQLYASCSLLQHPQHGTARMNTMFEESVQLSVTASVDPGIQNHSLFILEV